MTGDDRESSLAGGVFLIAAGVAITALAVRQFRDPVGATNAIVGRLGGKRLPEGLRPDPSAHPGFIRWNAVVVGIVGAAFAALGVVLVASVFFR
jgi:hypothetical protein